MAAADCPVGLRGLLTRWLLEISPGVFIGNPSARIREVLWDEVRKYTGKGRTLLAYTTDNEQGYAFATHDHKWHPADHEGLTLIHRPADRTPVRTPGRTAPDQAAPGQAAPGQAASSRTTPGQAPDEQSARGWSKASKRRRFGSR
ncbi:type I-E CRISPR-associated endoribonuclease Cas2e [Kitasatospora sp. NPDC088548]|uniref:type I-E CRISPR-associated endoribonuclease Cas2e n=1 Tax=Kitasatospora sp. NPDC088548 TaxID=3364075 RepID=UPI003801EAD5